MLERNSMQHKEAILLLAKCISALPGLQRKVLAIHYLENMQLSDIAACLGLSIDYNLSDLSRNFCTTAPCGLSKVATQ